MQPNKNSAGATFDGSRRQYLKAGILAMAFIPLTANSNTHSLSPITVTDALGRQVRLDRPPQRIVSIFASNTELIHALGATNRIVGIEDFTRFPPDIREGRTIIGGRLGFSVEAIARLEPDLIVMTPARQAVNTLLKPMETIGVPVLVLLHRDLQEIFSNLSLLGRVLGNEKHADQVVAQLQRRLTMIDRQLEGVQRPRVYFETGQNDRGNFTTIRKGHYTYDALLQAGAESIFADLDNINQVSGEAIIAANPDVILVARNEGSVDSIKKRPGWQNIQAIRDDRVFMVPRELFLIPGPRIIDGVKYLAPLLHPQIFSDRASV
ncbi:ABC transporter substrate-binding protein [Methylophaga muralis]|uniref:Vitamin B12-binding protein n=1 Tax=Methylophaga muralis TaxID=291169 RepID=A0A1E3GRF3_9GAMM|nr:ABC transporter substrate-binding protein [Methylophaga muralis]ODN66166.1 Vitamin B12-binding protein precursor [Methylophaga muralis]